MSEWLTRVLVAPVHFYQRFISSASPVFCRYHPTCPAYVVAALKVHGLIRDLLLALRRLLRYNPLTHGGVDHTPDKGQRRYRYSHDVPRFTVEGP